MSPANSSSDSQGQSSLGAFVARKRPEASSQPSEGIEQAGEPYAKRRNAARLLLPLAIVGIFVLAGVIGLLVGPVRRGEIWVVFQRIAAPEPPQFELIEARDGTVLVVAHQDDHSYVKVKRANYAGWIDLSPSDGTASNPALSLAGKHVAYLSEQGRRHIVVASVCSDTRGAVEESDVKDKCGRDWEICPWSPVHWSPDEEHLAFFACLKETETSCAAVAELQITTKQIETIDVSCVDKKNSEATTPDGRALIWLDESHLVITTPGDGKTGARIDTLDLQ